MKEMEETESFRVTKTGMSSSPQLVEYGIRYSGNYTDIMIYNLITVKKSYAAVGL